jgi:ribosomal protein S18 acetylase RimI-like enzyme
MSGRERTYPETAAGPFPVPPSRFTDREGREIVVRPYEADDYESLVAMYDDFDPSDRAQGIPPSGETRIRSWLETLLDDDSYNVVAAYDGEVVGHATLVPDGDGAYELAIFVHQTYQRAGIGKQLIRGLLGHGADQGVEKVWLTVERWNRAGVGLYKDVGFTTADSQRFEQEMAIRL